MSFYVDSIASKYYCRLKDQSGIPVAIFDNWINLRYEKELNNVGSYIFSIDEKDPRVDLFQLDSQFEIYRSIPGSSVDWYLDFEGFHRKPDRIVNENGEGIFTSEGVGYNDLLARTCIGYKGGTIRADKNIAAETAMKEYVYENCGDLAIELGVVGRMRDGVLSGFYVEGDLGTGPVWSGTRPFENLLDVLIDIANFSNIDFTVEGIGLGEFLFYTGTFGQNRSTEGLDTSTGKNPFGNHPVILSLPDASLAKAQYFYDRLSEANVVMVLGQSELSTRVVVVRADEVAISGSPWNRREISRPGSNQEFIYQLNALGDEVLEEMRAKEEITLTPLQQPSSLYGKHYFYPDTVTIRFNAIETNLRIIKVVTEVSASGAKLSFTFK